MPAKRARSYHLVKLTVRCSPPRACGCVIPEHGFAQSALSHAHLFGRALPPAGRSRVLERLARWVAPIPAQRRRCASHRRSFLPASAGDRFGELAVENGKVGLRGWALVATTRRPRASRPPAPPTRPHHPRAAPGNAQDEGRHYSWHQGPVLRAEGDGAKAVQRVHDRGRGKQCAPRSGAHPAGARQRWEADSERCGRGGSDRGRVRRPPHHEGTGPRGGHREPAGAGGARYAVPVRPPPSTLSRRRLRQLVHTEAHAYTLAAARRECSGSASLRTAIRCP